MLIRVSLLALFVLAAPLRGATYRFESLDGLELHNLEAELVTYRGSRAVRLIEVKPDAGPSIAVISSSDFNDGEIEAEIVGVPGAAANETARGFVGIAFRVQ